MTRARWSLAALALVVLAALVALLWLTTNGSPTTTAAARPGARTLDEGQAPPAVGPGRPMAGSPATASPSNEPAPPSAESGDPAVVTRDDRGGPAEPPGERVFAPASSAALRAELRILLKDCARPLWRADNHRTWNTQTELVVSVRDGAVHIDQLALRNEGLESDEFDGCVRAALEGRAIPAADGQGEIARYSITTSFSLP